MHHETDNPYVGPRTFSEAEQDLFFGREREAQDLHSLVLSERLVLFYAQSGAGKSSLIHTRLLPGLRQAGFEVLPVGRVRGDLPEGITNVDNVFVFNLILSLDQDQHPAAGFGQTTLNAYLGQRKTATPAAQKANEQTPRILVIDQFEEIFTTNLEHWEQREGFFRQLGQLTRDDPWIWVVLSLREDYVAPLEPYARLLPGKLRTRYYMRRLGHQAALEAVERPAQKGGRPFAPGVAQVLVDNLRQMRLYGQDAAPHLGEFVEPVQLQVVCYQLWENLKARPPREITEADLRELGNVDTALAQFYEQAIEEAVRETRVSEIDLRDWFESQLITEAGTRGMAYRGLEQTGGLSNPAVDLLADKFLLRAEVRPGGTWYELVHDRFVEPILQANQKWRLKQPLIQMCKAWLDSGKSPGRLLEGQQLQEALATNWQGLGPLVEEFLEASQAAQAAREEALRAEREAQRQRALEQAQALAEEQRRRAEEQARSSRRLRILATGLAVIFVVALAVAILAVGQRREAQRQSRLAERQASAALAAQQTAEAEAGARATAQAQAEARRVEAQRAEGEALAAEATAVAARAQAEGRRVEAETAQAGALAAQATSESARGTAEARELQAQTAVASQAEALATLSANIEAQLAAAVALPLAPTSVPTPSPTPSPTGLSTPRPEVLPPGLPTATPTATPTPVPPGGTPAPDLAATATIQALQAQLAQVQATQTAVAAAIPAVSFPPAGRILFVSNRDQQAGTWGDLYANPWGALYSMNADGGDVRRLIADFGAQPSYSPRGDRIAFSRPHPDQVPGVSLYAMNPDGQAETGIDRRFWDNWEPALAPDGEQVAFVSSRNNRGWEIYLMDGSGPDPDTLVPLTCDRIPPDLDKWGPAWSPDGRRIAFVVQPDAASNGEDAGSADIWVIEVASGDCTRLTDDGFMNKRPAWRDSQNLAFISDRDGGFDIYAMNGADPARLANLTASPRADEDYVAWSPDGNWLAFSRQVDGQDEVFVMTANGEHLTNLTQHPADDWDPIWIP